MPDPWMLILAGAFAGGFVSGLTGFGTGLTALPFWLHAVAPVLAGPLVVVCSIVAQVQTLPAIWHAVDLRRLAPFVAGGALGVPLGTVLLAHVSADGFKLGVGVVLVLYCGYLLASGAQWRLTRGGRIADGVVGLGGGVLGGLAGLSGPLPTVWAMLRGWDKDAKRGVFQGFNLSVLLLALVSQTAFGFITLELGRLVLIALPGTLLGAWAGRKVYDRLDNRRFDKLVYALLFTSGLILVGSWAWRRMVG